MRFFKTLITSCILFLQSCEQLEQSTETEDQNNTTVEDNNNNENVAQKKTEEPSKKELPEAKKPKPVEKKVKPKDLAKVKAPSTPQKAKFTPELLSAVKNWNLIPKSVFPLANVTIKKEVQFTAYSSSGQAIGSSMLPAGKEVFAIGHKGSLLAVSPSKNGSMRGTIAIDSTDFKDGVAYLFEMRKRQRIAYAERKANKTNPALSKTSSPSKTKSVPKAKPSTPLFEDLPSPGDYGHGKFCICSDCRTKRLAQTGSIK